MMNCEIIQDLLPLYADDCCSPQSRELVEAHIAQCAGCRRALQAMGKPIPVQEARTKKPSRIGQWSASVLQSVLLFLSFTALVFGVKMEASSNFEDITNSLIAFWLVIPVTGFLLSMVNWYFVRLYPNRRSFVLISCALTAVLSLAAYLWGLWHYEVGLETVAAWTFRVNAPGIGVTALLTAVSAGASFGYATLLGKE